MIPTELSARQDRLEARLMRLEAEMEAVQATLAARRPDRVNDITPGRAAFMPGLYLTAETWARKRG